MRVIAASRGHGIIAFSFVIICVHKFAECQVCHSNIVYIQPYPVFLLFFCTQLSSLIHLGYFFQLFRSIKIQRVRINFQANLSISTFSCIQKKKCSSRNYYLHLKIKDNVIFLAICRLLSRLKKLGLWIICELIIVTWMASFWIIPLYSNMDDTSAMQCHNEQSVYIRTVNSVEIYGQTWSFNVSKRRIRGGS